MLYAKFCDGHLLTGKVVDFDDFLQFCYANMFDDTVDNHVKHYQCQGYVRETKFYFR